MKKILFMAAIAAGTLMSCGGKKGAASTGNATDAEGKGVEVTEADMARQASATNIAWVEYDSLMSQYDLYKFYNDLMEKKAAEVQNTLEAKGKELQTLIENTQRKYENNGFSTKTELESAQNKINQKQQELAQLEYELKSNLAAETDRITAEARDSILQFIESYNSVKKFDYILLKGGNNMLYANPDLDITADIIKGLNLRYTGNK